MFDTTTSGFKLPRTLVAALVLSATFAILPGETSTAWGQACADGENCEGYITYDYYSPLLGILTGGELQCEGDGACTSGATCCKQEGQFDPDHRFEICGCCGGEPGPPPSTQYCNLRWDGHRIPLASMFVWSPVCTTVECNGENTCQLVDLDLHDPDRLACCCLPE